jgi:arylsulfatase A-like enzyme
MNTPNKKAPRCSPWIFKLVLLLVLNSSATSLNAQKVGKKPNLLIVLSDQHSYDMLGSSGNTQIQTPNLDKFAAEGLRLTHAFSNQPVCTPFRGMMMSGRHPLKNGTFVNDVPLLPNQSKLLGHILKENGYQTAYIGKWHLLGGNRDRPIPNNEMRYGFDEVLTNNCTVDFRPGRCFFWNDKNQKQYFNEWEVYGQTQQALSYLDNIDREKPFALIVSWHPPHDWGKFKGEDGKQHFIYDTLEELEKIYKREDIKVREGLETSADRKRMYHGYMAMVSGVDKAFGMLMDKLEAMGEKDKTLIMYTSDHGDMLESNGAVLPKQYPHDYSARIPFLMRFPKKIMPNTSNDLFFGALDIMPSTLGLLGLKTKQKFDGQDLSQAIIQGKSDAIKYVPLWNFQNLSEKNTNTWRGIVTKEYTFSKGYDDTTFELINVLFDRKKDPYQLHNLFGKPEYADIQNTLEKQMQKWFTDRKIPMLNAQEFLEIRSYESWTSNTEVAPIDIVGGKTK